MNKPSFSAGIYSVTPEHPSNWYIKQMQGVSRNTTLDGTDTKDLSWRKYQYTLMWDAMSKADFEALEELINYHLDSGTDISFDYEKFPKTTSVIPVHIEPLDRVMVAGSGSTFYYQNVYITITEVNSR